VRRHQQPKPLEPSNNYLSSQLPRTSLCLNALITQIKRFRMILMQSIGKLRMKKFKRWKGKSNKPILNFNWREKESRTRSSWMLRKRSRERRRRKC
jgi:hypothetical protein